MSVTCVPGFALLRPCPPCLHPNSVAGATPRPFPYGLLSRLTLRLCHLSDNRLLTPGLPASESPPDGQPPHDCISQLSPPKLPVECCSLVWALPMAWTWPLVRPAHRCGDAKAILPLQGPVLAEPHPMAWIDLPACGRLYFPKRPECHLPPHTPFQALATHTWRGGFGVPFP